MSLNTAHAQDGVLIYGGERILLFSDGVEFRIDPETKHPAMSGSHKGRIYLTTHRVIFNNGAKAAKLHSFSMPFFTLKSLELEQPIFGANYISGKVNAEQGGNWTSSAKFKLWFTHGGAIEFGQALLEAGKRATRNYRTQPPPAYYPMACDNYYMAPPPAYSPPQDPQYSFVPYGTFPNQPPPNSVYTMEAPPPYPGLGPIPPSHSGTHTPGAQPAGNDYTGMHGSPQPSAPPPPYTQATGAGPPPPGAPGYYTESNPHQVFAAAPPPQHNGYPSQQPQSHAKSE